MHTLLHVVKPSRQKKPLANGLASSFVKRINHFSDSYPVNISYVAVARNVIAELW